MYKDVKRIKDLETGAVYKSLYELVAKNAPITLQSGHEAIGIAFLSNVYNHDMVYKPVNDYGPLQKLIGHKFMVAKNNEEIIAMYHTRDDPAVITDITTGKSYSNFGKMIESNYVGTNPSAENLEAVGAQFLNNILQYNGMYCPQNKDVCVLPAFAGHKFQFHKKFAQEVANTTKNTAKAVKNNENEKETKEMNNTINTNNGPKGGKGGRHYTVRITDLTNGKVWESLSELEKEFSVAGGGGSFFVKNLKAHDMVYTRTVGHPSKFESLYGHKFNVERVIYKEGMPVVTSVIEPVKIEAKTEKPEPIMSSVSASTTAVKEGTDECILLRGGPIKKDKIEMRHYRMRPDVAAFLEEHNIELKASSCPIINETTGKIYDSIKALKAELSPEDSYEKFYGEFKAVLRSGAPYNGETYSYVDQYTRKELENIMIKAEVNNLSTMVIELKAAMENLQKLSEISSAKIKIVNELIRTME